MRVTVNKYCVLVNNIISFTAIECMEMRANIYKAKCAAVLVQIAQKSGVHAACQIYYVF